MKGDSCVACRMLLGAILSRGLYGAWSFHVSFGGDALCQPHAVARPSDIIVLVDGDMLCVRDFLNECSRRANWRRRGRARVPAGAASLAVMTLDCPETVSALDLLLGLASIELQAGELSRQFVWHIGGRVDAQIYGETQDALCRPLPLKPGISDGHKMRPGDPTQSDYHTIQFLDRYRRATINHFFKPMFLFLGLDAADIGKRNTMNFNIVGADNVCSVLAPKAHLATASRAGQKSGMQQKRLKRTPLIFETGTRFKNQWAPLIYETEVVDF